MQQARPSFPFRGGGCYSAFCSDSEDLWALLSFEGDQLFAPIALSIVGGFPSGIAMALDWVMEIRGTTVEGGVHALHEEGLRTPRAGIER